MKIEELNLKPQLVEAIKDLGFTEFTNIQEKCIPEILQGKDIFGHSSTGSGKTAAFGLPILEMITPGKGLQALILTPTRELCVQVTDAIETFGKQLRARVVSVYGGVAIGPQISGMKSADIVVGTPGRILDHIDRKTINFDKIKFFVLDEADKMFEMGFVEAVEDILQYIPKERQTLLFSATLSPNVQHLVKRHLKNPVTIKSQIHVDKSLLKQVYYVVQASDKFSLLLHLIKKNIAEGLVIIFLATRREVDSVARNLKTNGVNAMAIHGGLTQSRRLHALDSLKNEDINVLVATDVAARGLDIKNVTYIYNYDVPKTSDEYVHRIGRTARAGSSGCAVTLLSDRDYDNFNRVLSDRKLTIVKELLPEFERVKFNRQFNRANGGGRFGGGSGGRRFGGSSGGRRFGGNRDGDRRSSSSGRGFNRDGENRSSEGGRRFGGNRDGDRRSESQGDRFAKRAKYNS